MAAHVLRLLGHAVTLVEARSTIGGMLAHAIPAFRLAPDVARRETEVLVRGIAVRTNMPVGSNGVSIEGLRGTHDAVVVAAGASLALRLDAPGEDRPEVRTGLDLLAGLAARLVDDAAYGNRRVLVVGGGNVAIDCARAAIRLGAWGVDVVCLEQPHEMPAYAGEVRAALDEGVRFHHGWGVQAFTGNGRLYGAVLKRCARVFDENARFDPVFDERDTATLPADAAIVAVGQRADGSLLPRPLDGVFTAGDFATGPRSVVEAIASGREAALAADRYLGGAGALTLQLSKARGSAVPDRPGGFAQLARLEPATVPAEHRVSLSLMPRGLGPVDARREADRCLRCDLRLAYRQPVRPPSRHQRLPLSESNLPRVPEAGGVLRFYDQEGETLAIVGAADMRQDLAGRIPSRRATAFDFETCAMYTQRQNELLSRFVEAHGRMPPGVSEDDDLDGLF
jgi:thioredoxin reductase